MWKLAKLNDGEIDKAHQLGYEAINHLLMTLACVDICFILFYTSDISMNIWFTTKMSHLWYAYLYRYLVHPCKGLMMSSSIYMVVAISAER